MVLHKTLKLLLNEGVAEGQITKQNKTNKQKKQLGLQLTQMNFVSKSEIEINKNK